jgi:hypothetical protein
MTEVSEDKFELIPLEELTYFDLPNGMPCFVGNVDDICQHIEAHGYNFYYLMTVEEYSYTDTNKTTKTSTRPTIFKVVSTIISRSVTVATEQELNLETLSTSAEYTLPRIPYEMVQKMDDFFRAVEDKHGTESIVLLTYDPNFFGLENEGDGWGVLVPDQTNTAADCAYDHESIAKEKPEHVYLVGSAHSHPNMPAFASGTDHKDQADFPGIHITYGWRKNVSNNATEYHIELQTPGGVFSLDPGQVFDSFPKSDPSPDIDVWMGKVSKKVYTPTANGKTGVGSYGYTDYSYGYGAGGTSTTGYSTIPQAKKVTLPEDFPPIKDNIIIACISENDTHCPFCSVKFVKVDKDKRRCLSCHQYIMFDNETVPNVVAHRKAMGLFSNDIDIERSVQKPIYLWTKNNSQDKLELYCAADKVGDALGKD